MTTTSTPLRRRLPRPARAVAIAFAVAGLAAGCGSDDENEASTGCATNGDLAAVKDYLTEHTTDLTRRSTAGLARRRGLLRARRGGRLRLRAADGGERRRGRSRSSPSRQEAYVAANPAYEEMEGIVAGVPRLAQYDVDIDAGSDAADPESAVSFSLELPDGETLKQPGQPLVPDRDRALRDQPRPARRGVEQDVDGDGKVEFGEGLPDANIYVATMREFDEQAEALARRRRGVRADAVGRVHRDHGHDADDERVLRGVEELALRRRRGRRASTASSPPRASRTSPTSSRGSCSPTTRSSR